MDNSTLLIAIKERSEDGYSQFVQNNSEYVYSIIFNIAHGKLPVKELAAQAGDVFAAIWKNTGEITGSGLSTEQLLARLARNRSFKRLTYYEKKIDRLCDEIEVLTANPDGRISEEREFTLASQFEKIIAGFSATEKEIFFRYFYYGERPTDIAKKIGSNKNDCLATIEKMKNLLTSECRGTGATRAKVKIADIIDRVDISLFNNIRPSNKKTPADLISIFAMKGAEVGQTLTFVQRNRKRIIRKVGFVSGFCLIIALCILIASSYTGNFINYLANTVFSLIDSKYFEPLAEFSDGDINVAVEVFNKYNDEVYMIISFKNSGISSDQIENGPSLNVTSSDSSSSHDAELFKYDSTDNTIYYRYDLTGADVSPRKLNLSFEGGSITDDINMTVKTDKLGTELIFIGNNTRDDYLYHPEKIVLKERYLLMLHKITDAYFEKTKYNSSTILPYPSVKILYTDGMVCNDNVTFQTRRQEYNDEIDKYLLATKVTFVYDADFSEIDKLWIDGIAYDMEQYDNGEHMEKSEWGEERPVIHSRGN